MKYFLEKLLKPNFKSEILKVGKISILIKYLEKCIGQDHVLQFYFAQLASCV